MGIIGPFQGSKAREVLFSDIESLNELSIYSVDTLVGVTPSVVVIGNNSNELMTNEVMTLFANLSEETLIIDPWRSYTDYDNTSADLYHLGLGLA